MFTNVGWSEILVLGVIALVVLGPERLPEAARWLASAIRKVKDFAGSAQQQLRDDYGADFDEFREPLKQLNDLRGLSPRAMVTKHLLDGDDSLFSGDFGAAAPVGGAAVTGTPSTGPRPHAAGPAAAPGPASAPAPASTTGGAGGPVWDTDAT
ncbi:Sec-independent protein translocase protein TatB [Rhodococcus sp. IEGM 1408]|uniref:Sec-independent protein translocase protein TatB n=1 Tax=Rhodococcus sp. IEGM 1408 TaxID=3082220 RepID=UPI0029555089|nr:Sec-independent protein translocase protein TatB [Rhodococcus sp. IEGM 1408]MDV8000590.1 Sec-independent protein translocase protein TatB [Rhodococcus sp. IEGM 1408]